MAGRRRDPGTTIAKRRRGQVPQQEVGAKGAQVVRDGRIVAVQVLIAEGVPELEVLRWLTTEITEADVITAEARGIKLLPKPWKVSEPTGRDYIRTALRVSAALNARDAKTKHNRVKDEMRAELIFRRAVEDRDWNAARLANDQLIRIHGTYEPEVIPEAEEGEDMDLTEATGLIDHAADTLALARRRGAITPAQIASAIDVEGEAAPVDGDPVVIEDPTEIEESAPPAAGGN